MTYVIVAYWRPREGQAEKIEAILRELAPAARTEPGNLEFIVNRSHNDPNEFLLYEQYKDEQAFVDHTLIGGSTLFPRDHIAGYIAALNSMPARLMLERRNIDGSQLRVVDFSKFRGKPVLVLTGTNDLGHARDRGRLCRSGPARACRETC